VGGTYQYTRGVQTGGAGPSILANWAVTSAVARPIIGRNWTSVGSRTIALIADGQDYGDNKLHQLDLKFSKTFRSGRTRVRADFDVFNLLNSSWPFTVSSTYSTAATSQYLRPTNVLQHRFFKLGTNISF